jgi:membrane associated rhomboid family serine protease
MKFKRPVLPPATRAIVVANAILFLCYFIFGALFRDRLALWPWHTYRFQAWELLTYSFMQINLVHLLINMAALVFFGRTLEPLWGARNFLVYYFASVLAGGGIWLVWAAVIGYANATAGASGGVFGLLLAYAIVDPRAAVVEGMKAIPRWIFVLVFGSLELLLGFFDRNAGVAHFAHVGGMAGGALVFAFWGTRTPALRH